MRADTPVFYVAAPNLAQGARKLGELAEASWREEWKRYVAERRRRERA